MSKLNTNHDLDHLLAIAVKNGNIYSTIELLNLRANVHFKDNGTVAI